MGGCKHSQRSRRSINSQSSVTFTDKRCDIYDSFLEGGVCEALHKCPPGGGGGGLVTDWDFRNSDGLQPSDKTHQIKAGFSSPTLNIKRLMFHT